MVRARAGRGRAHGDFAGNGFAAAAAFEQHHFETKKFFNRHDICDETNYGSAAAIHSFTATMIPTPDQILLLRASLLSGQDVATAWKAWRERVNFDDIDAASYRLMPLLYKNLRRENIEDELLGRLKGIYRHTWSRNQLLFHEAGRVLKAMNDAGISVLVLKGATLANSFYSDAGLRPMNDFDFMVPLDEAFRAFEVMNLCG